MEEYLIENYEILNLDDDSLSNVEVIKTEVPIAGGRASLKKDGRLDILVKYNQETLGIIELKLGEINEDAFSQLIDYMNKKDEIINHIDIENTSTTNWVGILIGTSISPEIEKRISNGELIDNSIPVAALTINRFRGKDNNIYVITNTYFNNKSRIFDRTKYLFQGKEYGKGRLVLAVIKYHLSNKNEYSLFVP